MDQTHPLGSLLAYSTVFVLGRFNFWTNKYNSKIIIDRVLTRGMIAPLQCTNELDGIYILQ